MAAHSGHIVPIQPHFPNSKPMIPKETLFVPLLTPAFWDEVGCHHYESVASSFTNYMYQLQLINGSPQKVYLHHPGNVLICLMLKKRCVEGVRTWSLRRSRRHK